MPVKLEPRTRTLEILAFGGERAHDPRAGGAVSGDVALRVLVGDDLVVLADRDDDRALELADQRMGRRRRPSRGCTRERPSPVEPPSAHSRVTRSGHSEGSAIRSTASFGRLQAGSAALLASQL